MAEDVSAPMGREEFMERLARLQHVKGPWVYAWLVGWLQMDLTDQMRGDALAAVESTATAVVALPLHGPLANGDSPPAP